MGLAISKIKEDRFYRTENDEVRHVSKIKDGKVRSSSRGGRYVPRPWGNFRTTAIEKFAADVIEEVVETWDVRYSNPTPAQAKARKSAKKTPKAKKTVKAGKAKKTVKKTKKAKRKK